MFKNFDNVEFVKKTFYQVKGAFKLEAIITTQLSLLQGSASRGSVSSSSSSQGTNSESFKFKANTRWDSKGMIRARVIQA